MPVTRPEYGRKPKPSVTAPDFSAKKTSAKSAAEKAARAAAAAAVTTPPIVK